MVYEGNKSNNTSTAIPFTFNLVPPNLAPNHLSVVAGTSLVVTSYTTTIPVAWSVTNSGTGAAVPASAACAYWYDAMFLSTNSTVDGNAVQVWSQNQNGTIPVGSGYSGTNPSPFQTFAVIQLIISFLTPMRGLGVTISMRQM